MVLVAFATKSSSTILDHRVLSALLYDKYLSFRDLPFYISCDEIVRGGLEPGSFRLEKSSGPTKRKLINEPRVQCRQACSRYEQRALGCMRLDNGSHSKRGSRTSSSHLFGILLLLLLPQRRDMQSIS